MLLMVLLLMYRFIVRFSVWLFIFLIRQVIVIVGMLFSVRLSRVCSISSVVQLFISVVFSDSMVEVSSVVIINGWWLIVLDSRLVNSIVIVSVLVVSDSDIVLLVVDMLKWWLNLGSSGCMVYSRLKVEKLVRNSVSVVWWKVGVFCWMWVLVLELMVWGWCLMVVVVLLVMGLMGWWGMVGYGREWVLDQVC